VSGGAHPGAARTARLQGLLQTQGLDALVIDSPFDLRYLTGFTGSNGLLLVRAPGAGAGAGAGGGVTFFTDFRYLTQAGEQIPPSFEREIAPGDLLDAAAAALGDVGGTLGFDARSLTVARHQRLAEQLSESWQPVAGPGLVERLRLVKEPAEVDRIRAAAELADAALAQVLQAGLRGRTERDVAIDLELRMRRLGAQAPSFTSIVASGSNGALPHASPTAREIAPDVLVTIDWGAELDGYCSDCTRTYATGEGISERAREIYALVLDAQERGLQAVAAGSSGRAIDAVARAVIEAAGEGEHFGHGLGHGVGLEVHEGPRLSRTADDEPLPVGCIVTVEPGIYLPGELGVRIEDLVAVGDGTREVLTRLPKELTVIS
jgi:Xaa-Pro aminopeptidase